MTKLEIDLKTDDSLQKNSNGFGVNTEMRNTYNRTLLWRNDTKQATASLSEPSTNFERIMICWYVHDGIDFGNKVFEIPPYNNAALNQFIILPTRLAGYMRFNLRKFMWNNASSISITYDRYANLKMDDHAISYGSDGSGAYCYIYEVWGINRK